MPVNVQQGIIQDLSVEILLNSVNLRASLQAHYMQIIKEI